LPKLPTQVSEFLSNRSIAVAGVSRDCRQPANAVYRKLRASGYRVFAVNPNTPQVEGDPCYPSIGSVPETALAVVIATHPNTAVQIVRDCAELGIHQIWFHRSFGQGSVSDEAVRECQKLGISCLVGGCPLMYCKPVDLGHRCMRWILKLQDRVPH